MEATQSQNRQHSNSVCVFIWGGGKKNGLVMNITHFANILVTGNSNNIVFTLFPIMNKMRV